MVGRETTSKLFRLKQGIITMRISFIDANGHTTLWDKDNFVDTALGVSANYLNETQYIIQDLYFWDLIG
ncbi:type VI secretion system amidase effector protein Tae4 [Helicobacter sp. MIT 14-3879]|uniref:type VI secretion system amidase effector protein Tae4 n=1 Tax=Helicobacter sp. MIT 14-3879 TaxID=2040649 RepID=UPI0021625084|nr:type VI secretion system amidase effector protein Tae4 [Helicobacter sp. MIT 14-3879]